MNGNDPSDDLESTADPADRKKLWWWLTIAGAVVVLAIVGILVAMAVAGQPSQPGQGPSGQQSDSAGESPNPDESGGSETGSGDPTARKRRSIRTSVNPLPTRWTVMRQRTSVTVLRPS